MSEEMTLNVGQDNVIMGNMAKQDFENIYSVIQQIL